MKKLLSVMIAAIMLLAPMVLAVDIGEGIGIDITTEDFPPLIWLCDHRVVLDDAVEPGRISYDGQTLFERINNYAFEGEQIGWSVLVMDKNGIEKIEDVYVTIGDAQGEGNDIEANCDINNDPPEGIDRSCNARIDEEQITTFDSDTMRYYNCLFTVETPESMYGEYWVTAEVTDLDGISTTIDENEYWFLNPEIALSIDGALEFTDVRPGTQAYSDTLLVGNDADDSSGVMLDMFISGTDFYDSSSSGAKCPTTNQLTLDNFRYYAVNGAYSTATDAQVGVRGFGALDNRARDLEGYVNIGYGNSFNDPTPFYNGFEIIQAAGVGGYWAANVLAPGAEMAITFKLSLPEPCNGDFDSGSLYFWAEAI